jgi:hypothetical protein
VHDGFQKGVGREFEEDAGGRWREMSEMKMVMEMVMQACMLRTCRAGSINALYVYTTIRTSPNISINTTYLPYLPYLSTYLPVRNEKNTPHAFQIHISLSQNPQTIPSLPSLIHTAAKLS